MPSAAVRRSEADQLIETLHTVAADPALWESLVTALADAPADAPSEADMDGLEDAPVGPPAVGLLLLAADGAVVGWNAAGKSLLRGKLGADDAAGRPLFSPANHEALVEARRRLGETGAAQVIVRLVQAEDEDPRFAYVGPIEALPATLRQGVEGREAPRAKVAVIFPAPENTDRLWMTVRASFGLTAAETRLAARLKAGRTLKEAADDLGVSLNTVRNQLRAVFDKMGLNRQSELVRALAQLSALSNSIQPEPAIVSASEAGALMAAPPVRIHRLPDGRALAYREYGRPDGRPCMVFHQGLGSSLLPRGSDELARDLGLRIVCAERPGVGRSDLHPDLSLEAVAADLGDLTRALDMRRVRVAAMMYGAAFALSYAEDMAGEVEHVLLASARPTGAAPERPEDRRNPLVLLRRRMLRLRWVAGPMYAVFRRRLSHSLVERMVRAGASAPGDGAYLARHPGVVDFIQAYMGESLTRGSEGVARETVLLASSDGASWPRLRAPVSVWHGAEDTVTSVEEVLSWLGHAPHQVRVFDGVGHFLPHKHWPEIMGWMAA